MSPPAKRMRMTKSRSTMGIRGKERLTQGYVPTSSIYWTPVSNTGTAPQARFDTGNTGLLGGVLSATAAQHYIATRVVIYDTNGELLQGFNWTPTPAANFFRFNVPLFYNAQYVTVSNVAASGNVTSVLKVKATQG